MKGLFILTRLEDWYEGIESWGFRVVDYDEDTMFFEGIERDEDTMVTYRIAPASSSPIST